MMQKKREKLKIGVDSVGMWREVDYKLYKVLLGTL